jgi:drug/metabolite transporter (DMT)-like permease
MTVPMTAHRARAFALLFASMSLVGTYVALSKPLVAVIPVFLLATLRFGIAAVAMLPWTFAQRGEAPLARDEHRWLFLTSFFGNFLFSICMLYGVSMTSATAAGVIMAAIPAVVAALSWLVLREPLGARAAFAIALAVGGIGALQVAQPADARTVSWVGNLLVLGSVFCEATYVILGKRLAANRTPLRISALINLWGFVLILPLGAIHAAGFAWTAVSAATWVLLIFYSIAASLIAPWLWLAGLRAVPANQAGVFTVALPLAATMIGVLAFGEAFTALTALALGCALAGIVVISWPVVRVPQEKGT